jgi:hypothetical protein
MDLLSDTKEKIKVYIAGPMRGIQNQNKKSFYKAEKKLSACNLYEIYNPARMDDAKGITEEDLENSETLKEVVRDDIDFLLNCDGIYMLRSWENSVGARAEHAIAVLLKIFILYE